jgi:hypothetical protein
MTKKNLILTMIVAFFATTGTLVAQEKYAIIIGGNMNPGTTIPATEQWNGGLNPGTYGFDEIWNDAYLAWEMLISEEDFGKGYHVDNVHVLFGDYPAQDFTFPEQDDRYQAEYNDETYVVDEDANESTIANRFTNLASTITADDFLFVWIMGHGGTNLFNGKSYFYSYDNQKIYDSDLAGWLDDIDAHKKTVFLSFPKSGGFVPELEAGGNIVITACGAAEGASRADDLAPGTPLVTFIENEVLDGITYNHGEVNYHLTSSLTGFTPKGEDVYAGNDLDLADINSDNYIAHNETWSWTSAKETLTGESPVLSDLGNIKLSTELTYPTLLWQNITNGVIVSVRGLVGISKGFQIEDGSTLRFFDNSKIHILRTMSLYGFPESEVSIGDGVLITSNMPYVNIILFSNNFSIGDNVSFISDTWENNMVLSGKPIESTINNLNSTNCYLNFVAYNLIINSSNFTTSVLSLSQSDNKVIHSNFYSSKFIGSTGVGVGIFDCVFTNDQSMYGEELYNDHAISFDHSISFNVSDCSIDGYYNTGILVDNSGFSRGDKKISNTSISNIQNQAANGTGIRVYSSDVEITDLNDIYNNDFGIMSLNNSETRLYGIRDADYVHETQQIHDNSVNQVYATAGAFPYEMRFNAIYDEDDSCLVKYVPNPIGIPQNLEVIYNY